MFIKGYLCKHCNGFYPGDSEPIECTRCVPRIEYIGAFKILTPVEGEPTIICLFCGGPVNAKRYNLARMKSCGCMQTNPLKINRVSEDSRKVHLKCSKCGLQKWFEFVNNGSMQKPMQCPVCCQGDGESVY